MDGNGRWATQRNKYRTSGHKAGVKSVRKTIRQASKLGIKWLTLFAFSSENWSRPEKEVSMLMELFTRALKKEVPELHENGVKLNFIGDLSKFSSGLRTRMEQVANLTQNNNKMVLTIAVNYGGRWDIVQASKKLALAILANKIKPCDINEDSFIEFLSMGKTPNPDLLIRTGGEHRISNFLLWQMAYTELFFTSVLWPDFNEDCLNQAVENFQQRERRFGKAPKQIKGQKLC
ncbi:Undecaprenyl diphosphate synthase [hydrothermal vent metagenome]|uniref:Undecaprenyl diphosphate synthase n=1 Tax=hydrothermal vent metagenome TaxID=652676 RepID=A0A3B0V5J7_9ZZZZ